jgi:hypothetical protein
MIAFINSTVAGATVTLLANRFLAGESTGIALLLGVVAAIGLWRDSLATKDGGTASAHLQKRRNGVPNRRAGWIDRRVDAGHRQNRSVRLHNTS